jgi:hypothetical protein
MSKAKRLGAVSSPEKAQSLTVQGHEQLRAKSTRGGLWSVGRNP